MKNFQQPKGIIKTEINTRSITVC